MKKKDLTTRIDALELYIMEVDDCHGKNELELKNQIEQLKFQVNNLQRIVETMGSKTETWINTPVSTTIPFKVSCICESPLAKEIQKEKDFIRKVCGVNSLNDILGQ